MGRNGTARCVVPGDVQRVGGADDLAASLDHLLALPDHAHDGAGAHVVDEVAEEGLGGEVGVVLFEVFFAWHAELHGDELESSLFKSLKQNHD